MSEKKNKQERCLKWFGKDIWDSLNKKNKKLLLKRFKLKGSPKYSLKKILKRNKLKELPFGFAVVALNMKNIEDKSAYLECLNNNLFVEKLTFDEDKWGIIRGHKEYYGLLEQFDLDIETQMRFEQYLKSSISLGKSEKITVLKRLNSLEFFQVLMLMDVLSEEMSDAATERFINSQEETLELIKKAQKEWEEIEQNLDEYLYGEDLEKEPDFTPLKLKEQIQRSVKGQEEAVKKIATWLFYQKRVFDAVSKKEKLPFEPIKPILITGETGSGKSFLIKTGCELLDIPYIIVDSSSLVSAGIVGNTLNDVLKSLIKRCDYDKNRAQGAVVVFDEVDKLLGHHDGKSILFQMLKFVEGSDIPIDITHQDNSRLRGIDSISTEAMFFIFAGSFQELIDNQKNQKTIGFKKEDSPREFDIQKSNLPKELLGRIVDIVVLKKLTKEAYREILLNSEKSPLKRYQQMLETYGIRHTLNEKEIDSIIQKAQESPYGARALDKILLEHFEDLLFNLKKGA